MNNEKTPAGHGFGNECGACGDGCPGKACRHEAENPAAPAAAGTIDTPGFRKKLADLLENADFSDERYDMPRAAFVAHINQHVAAAVAEAEKKHAARVAHLTHERDHARACYTKLASLTASPAATAPVSAEKIDCGSCLGTGNDGRGAGCTDCNGKGYSWDDAAPVSAAEQAIKNPADAESAEGGAVWEGSVAQPADGQELPALPKCAAYGVIGATGFDPNDGHRQLIGISVGKPGSHAAGRIVRLYTEDQVAAAMRQPQGNGVMLTKRFAADVLGALFWRDRFNPEAYEAIKQKFATIMQGAAISERAAKQAGKEG